jgi:hypothetical protein
MNDAKLAIVLEAKNNASPAIRQTTKDLRELDSAAGNVANGLSGIAKTAGVAGILALGTAAAGVTMELARTGAMVDQTRTAFMDLATSAGMSGQSILESLRAAARGSISDMALMETANRAMMLGVADNAEEFGQLMQIAEARGKALAVSTEQAFSDIVIGIGRQSALILDNLGIIVDTETAYARYAESVGKTAAELSDAERKQAMLNDVIANSASIVAANNAAGENMVDQFERMDTAAKNATAALGEYLAPHFAQMAGNLAGLLERIAFAMPQGQSNPSPIGDPQSGFEAEVANYYQAAIRGYAELAAAHRERLAEIEREIVLVRESGASAELQASYMRRLKVEQDAIAAATQKRAEFVRQVNAIERVQIQTTNESITAFLDLEAASRRTALGLAAAGDAASATGGKFLNMGADALAAREALDLIVQGQRQAESAIMRNASKLVGNMGGAGAVGWIKEQNAALQDQWELWNAQGFTQREINEVLLPAYLSGLDETVNKLTDTRAATRAIEDAAREAQQEFDALKGKVAGVLSGALDVGVGVDVANFLPREDAVNEQARRLADIMVNGLTGQDWMGAFAEGAPDIYAALTESGDPKAAAARLLADFQDGLVPELIDKDKAKDLVRRMLTGEQNMAELAQEIAGELSGELGVSTAQALAAAQGALGVGEATQLGPTGADAATAFSDGFDVALQELGPRAAATIEKSAASDAVVRQLTGAGRNAGTIWGDGFLAAVGQNIPQALIDILTMRVLPAIQGGMTAQAGATAAQ